MDDDADAKIILTAPPSPSENWKRPPGRPRITWMNTVQPDLRAYNLTLNEAVDLAQNRHVEADVYIWRYALLVVLARKEEEVYCSMWIRKVSEVSQANVASRLGYDGVVNDDYIANLLPSLEGKNLVKIGRDDEVTCKITVQSDTFF